ncbi:hypothetical protein STEG23_036328, partial [Scotinomys teguina]
SSCRLYIKNFSLALTVPPSVCLTPSMPAFRALDLALGYSSGPDILLDCSETVSDTTVATFPASEAVDLSTQDFQESGQLPALALFVHSSFPLGPAPSCLSSMLQEVHNYRNLVSSECTQIWSNVAGPDGGRQEQSINNSSLPQFTANTKDIN